MSDANSEIVFAQDAVQWSALSLSNSMISSKTFAEVRKNLNDQLAASPDLKLTAVKTHLQKFFAQLDGKQRLIKNFKHGLKVDDPQVCSYILMFLV